VSAAVPTTASVRPKRRWFSPRFSLKMLMLAVTAAAVGSAVWWRWPVTIKSVIRRSPLIEDTTTYHRGLWGNLIEHGVYRRTVDGKIEREIHFYEGEAGACEYRTENTVLAYEYKNRKLIAAPHGPRGSLLVQRMNDPALKKSAESLWADVDLDYATTPLKELIDDLHERFGLCLALRPRRTDVYETPITVNVKGWPIRMGFDAILSPRGLVLDYRYGVLCIVDAEGAANWQDFTGAMELQPPPESSLAERLDAPAKLTRIELQIAPRANPSSRPFNELPLSSVLRNLGAQQDVSVKLLLTHDDWEKLEARDDGMLGLPSDAIAIRGNASPVPSEPLPITLRQLLALILDKAELKCREEKGVLIIEPMPKESPTQVKKIAP
jgi:hypothetical protein